jgi:hypothetical protein
MVPCLAIGITGILVTSIGRLLLALPHGGEIPASVPVAMVIVIAIMVVCSIAAAISSRMGPQRSRTAPPH